MNCIDKAFVVSLKGRKHRWKLFKELNDSRIELFQAIDTRTNPIDIAKQYGFTINPSPGGYSDYFSESKGGIGCYLSHYSIWKKIVKDKIDCTLVIEDDAEVNDIRQVLRIDTNRYKSYLGVEQSRPFHLIQLNRRTTTVKSHVKNLARNTPWRDVTIDMIFNGTESYLLSLEGAKRLIWLAEHNEFFHDLLIYPTGRNCPRNEFGKHIKFKDEREGKCIWSPVDKFMGRCTGLSLSNDRRVNVLVRPRVSLHHNIIKSDIMEKNSPHWSLNRKALMLRRSQEPYGWWGPGPNLIKKEKIFEIGVKKTGTSSLGAAYYHLNYRAAAWNPELYDEWIETGEKDYDLLFAEIEKYEAFQDGPWHDCDYKKLDVKFPGSKFILLERDDESWLKSVEKHESPEYNVNNIDSKYLYDEWIIDRESTKAKRLEWKNNKYKEIKRYFANRPEDLLIMNICAGDGWEKLCPFLGKKPPLKPNYKPFPFPCANKSKKK